MAGNIYKKLKIVYERTGGKSVVESAFCRLRHSFLIKLGIDARSTSNNAAKIRLDRLAAPAMRSAKWGMRSFQVVFAR